MRSVRPLAAYCIVMLGAGLTAGCGRMREARRLERERIEKERIRQAEATIRASTIEWSKAAQARDLDKAVYYYAEDAVQLADKGPVVEGKENIRKGWQQMLALPGPGLTFETTSVDVARYSDMAWERGTYDFGVADKNGKVTDTKGKYLVVWKKEPGNIWKVVADIDNTGQ